MGENLIEEIKSIQKNLETQYNRSCEFPNFEQRNIREFLMNLNIDKNNIVIKN